MKKTGIWMSAIIIILALVVGIVGITAAWFSNDNEQILTVSSEQPSTSATIVMDSDNPINFPSDDKLRPAVLKAGLTNADRTGSNRYDTIPVPYAVAGESAPSYDTNVFSDYARAVKTTVPVKYGSGSAAKTLKFSLLSVTLTNPRSEDNDGNRTLPNYIEEFVIDMSKITREDKSASARDIDVSVANSVTFTVDARYTYIIEIVVYFRYADEFTSPELNDTNIFFNFELTVDEN